MALQNWPLVEKYPPSRGIRLPKYTLKELWRRKHCYLFIFPTMAVLFVFLYYPILSALVHAFTNWDGYTPAKYIGIDNFIKMYQDPDMLMALRNMFIFSIGHLLCDLVTSVGIALLLFELGNRRINRAFQTVFVLPIMIPFIITAFLWKFIYDPQFGLGNTILTSLGLRPQLFLGDPNFAMLWLVFLGFPWVWGPGVLMQLSGLHGISNEIHDSARVDGVNWWQRVRKIDLPLIIPQIRVLAILSMINSLQTFLYQMVLTEGGPSNTTTVPGYIIYKQGIKFSHMGYACAVGVVVLIIIFITTAILQRIGRNIDT